MDVNRAYNLGVRADRCSIRSVVGYRLGRWVVYCDGSPVTEDSSIFAMTRFVASLKRMEDRNA